MAEEHSNQPKAVQLTVLTAQKNVLVFDFRKSTGYFFNVFFHVESISVTQNIQKRSLDVEIFNQRALGYLATNCS